MHVYWSRNVMPTLQTQDLPAHQELGIYQLSSHSTKKHFQPCLSFSHPVMNLWSNYTHSACDVQTTSTLTTFAKLLNICQLQETNLQLRLKLPKGKVLPVA